jgi:L-ascorbate metabolism protein UlaG (beta-lactamase superfamily)
MDHLHPPTLRALTGSPRVVTAHATANLIPDKLGKCKELKWGEKTRIKTRNGDIQVSAFEVRHWGARWRYDKYRGYNGYVLEREGKRLLFGGDTAWTESFRGLRRKRPFDLAFMPIGAYQPWICSHCTPEQAVRMANDAGAKHFAPIHFKTFPFGREGTHEPMERLESSLESERMAWRDIGQTFRLT